MGKWYYVPLALCLALCAARPAACEEPKADPTTAPSDVWQTASISEAHLDAGLIKQACDRINDGTYKNIHSVLLVKDGKLVVEWYFRGTDEAGVVQDFQRDTLHDIASATKSVNSLLVGIAIDRHLIKSVDERISTFFPEYADIFADKKKDAIRLSDCLSMTAGLAWDEWSLPYTDPRNDHVAMNASADPVRYVLERPMADVPGRKFVYNSGVAIMVGEIIHKASRLGADAFAERYLFGPLGITKYNWIKYPNGMVQTGGGLWMRPRDMAKIGLLCLNEGKWNDQQVVSAEWIRESTRQHAPDRDYGYGWWLGALSARGQKIKAFGAQGRGGQFIIVLPELKMVAVFTGWTEGALGEQPYDMLQRYILPAALTTAATKP